MTAPEMRCVPIPERPTLRVVGATKPTGVRHIVTVPAGAAAGDELEVIVPPCSGCPRCLTPSGGGAGAGDRPRPA
jgi:hypothetical protein